jgi:imidazolonepropionase-like amidohydrolase
MPRLLALVALGLLLAACFAPPIQPASINALGSSFQPTILPTVTPWPPTATPIPSAVPTATIAATATAAPPTAVPLPKYDLVLAGATLIDATGAAPLPDAAVAIRDGRIAAVGRAGELLYSADTPVYDVSGGTLMPGFINAHVHITGLSENDLRRWTRAGVTTLRDLAGPLEERVQLRDSFLARNDPTLPRLLVSGPIITVASGYPFAVKDPHLRVASLAVHGSSNAHSEVARFAAAGIDQIKIALSGRTDVHWGELSDQELASIIETARAYGLPVTAHVDRASALRRAVLSGISDSAHSPRDRVPNEVFKLMVERGITMVPTIAVYECLAESRGTGDAWRRSTMPIMYDNIRRFVAMGGTLALGDDFGGVPGMPLGMPMDEIRHWIAAGLSPMDVIVAATRGGARVTGLSESLGTVEVGKVADLLVVEGDPLADYRALNRPLLVVHGGQVVEP